MSIAAVDREGFAAFLLRMRARGTDDRALMTAIEAVPRRDFVAPEYHDAVWGSRQIPLDCGETLEGLDFLAQTLRSLQVADAHRVLEIGTGSGYSAAVLSRLAKRVHTMERFTRLHDAAHSRFRSLKFDNVVAIQGDGAGGSSDGPFDRIIVWAAFDGIPRRFIDQLASGGSMICAIGEADAKQDLVRLTKVGSRFEREDLGQVRMQLLAHGLPKVL